MTDWHALCAGAGFELEGDDVIVRFENDRKHRVSVRETDDTFELRAVVAKGGMVRDIADVPMRVWRRNRSSQLVGFRQGRRGRLHGEGWVAKAGLTADEFQLVLRRVAAESDRFEYVLTGRDIE